MREEDLSTKAVCDLNSCSKSKTHQVRMVCKGNSVAVNFQNTFPSSTLKFYLQIGVLNTKFLIAEYVTNIEIL